MTPEKQASLLAEWLEKPPGTPPPVGVDADAIEAVYALRPELAPAPRVSIDDILAGVSEGPFARIAEVPISETDSGPAARIAEVPISEDQGEILQEADPETGRGEVVDLATARRRRQRIWGGVGVVAAAALALFTVFPQSDELENLAVEEMPAEMTTERPQEGADPNMDLADAEAVLEEFAPMAEPPAAPNAARQRTSSSSEWDEGALSSGRYDVVDLEAEEQTQAELKAAPEGGASYGPEPVQEHNAAPQAVVANTDFEDADSVDELTQQSASGGFFDRKTKDERSTRGATSSSSKTSSIDDFDEPASEPEPIPTDLDGLRASAVPSDYSPSWYLRGLDDNELDRFDAAVTSGDHASLIDDSNAFIGQDMAFRAAQAALASGDAGAALGYARRGQGRSSANTAFRANLYYIEGLALEQRGDTEGAKRAYTTAANLNRAR